jgi:DNA-binding transcriptional LysR family regulator
MISPNALFHPILLRSFVAVAEEEGFSRAARRLNLQQSTVSQHVARLEETVGQVLLIRTTKALGVTPAGTTMLEMARNILAIYERAQRVLREGTLRGQVRMGASEDFAIARLSPILSQFKQAHEEIDLSVTIAPSATLQRLRDAGELDLVVMEMPAGSGERELLRREPVHWYAMPGFGIDLDAPLALVLYQAPNVIRSLAIDTLAKAGRSWRETCTGSSFLGLRAATLAGLGITALSNVARALTVERLPADSGQPPLPDIDLCLFVSTPGAAVEALEESIRRSF